MIDIREIHKVAKRIGIAANADRIILFGSYARGEATENSDVDLLIIAKSDQPRFKRSRALYQMFNPYPFSMDLLVYTPDEIAEAKGTSLSFVSTALREGKILYER
ncbi:MAG: nucleotidyltransferase domain-containing protein [Candidatus Sumerlaeota bacterium]|nr:nucleotidyltransferase domain-containing protein [Candidatus Sumerlaeota bacterium]